MDLTERWGKLKGYVLGKGRERRGEGWVGKGKDVEELVL